MHGWNQALGTAGRERERGWESGKGEWGQQLRDQKKTSEALKSIGPPVPLLSAPFLSLFSPPLILPLQRFFFSSLSQLSCWFCSTVSQSVRMICWPLSKYQISRVQCWYDRCPLSSKAAEITQYVWWHLNQLSSISVWLLLLKCQQDQLRV